MMVLAPAPLAAPSAVAARFRAVAARFRAVAARFRAVAAQLAGIPRWELDQRDLVATVYAGAYGPAGLLIAVNGSPPRGLFLVPVEALQCDAWAAYIGPSGRTKRVTAYYRADLYHPIVRYARPRWPEALARWHG